jgi:TIR domain
MDLFDIRPAGRLASELERGVTSADVLCILLSPTAVASPWVSDELRHAVAAEAKGLRILPIILRATAIPDELSDRVALDATRGLDDAAVALRFPPGARRVDRRGRAFRRRAPRRPCGPRCGRRGRGGSSCLARGARHQGLLELQVDPSSVTRLSRGGPTHAIFLATWLESATARDHSSSPAARSSASSSACSLSHTPARCHSSRRR